MRQNKSPSLRGSVTQNSVSVRMRAADKSGLGVVARLGLLAAVFLIIAALLALLWHAGWLQRQGERIAAAGIAATQKAQFSVNDIIVEGRQRTPKADIFDALATERGAPIFGFNSAAAAARLGKLPWVEAAQVERRLPDTLIVALTERVPVARWQQGGHFYVIDSQGQVLPMVSAEQFPALPLVVGADANMQAQSLFAVLKAYPALQEKIQSAARVGERRWDLYLQSGVVVRLPEDDIAGALHRLSVLINQDQILSRDIAAIDLRVPDRLIVQPAPAARTPKDKRL